MVDFAKVIQQNREKYNLENNPTGIPGKQFTTQVSITVAGSDYAVKFGYDAALLKKLKDAIPESERTWHKTQKVWLVSPDEIEKAIQAINQHTGQTIALPVEKPSAPEVLEKTFLVEYLGATKDRGRSKSAYGSVNGQWASEFPEEVLLSFFEKRELGQPLSGLQTLYQILCIFEKATPEEIKKAYKRLALHNHPDVNKEPDAHETFIKINEAYKVLNDPEQKRRYDAGLYFERAEQSKDSYVPFPNLRGYRAPLRCGQITARGTVRLMRFVVQEILKWDDVTNRDGKTMVSQWPAGADTFQILWV
jgi:hypothetical protein